MNAYRILDIKDDSGLSPMFFRHTLAAAHVEAKGTHYSDEVKPDVRVQLVEIPTTALSVIDYLNGVKPAELEIKRQWKLTPRGGLVELDADGKPLEKQA